MDVLIACEFSGRVREAFRRRGHNAWSCDLLPADDASPHHLVGDVRDWLARGPDGVTWDVMVAHPPCTYLTVSGLHWNTRDPARARETESALAFVRELMAAPVGAYALENPVGCISSRIRKPDQIVQPYQFGDDASKATCLWLKNLPKLRIVPALRYPGRMVTLADGKVVERWSNQTDSGQNRLGPSEDRWKLRSLTYPGIAEAFAENWG